MGIGESGLFGKWDLGFEVSRILQRGKMGILEECDFGKEGFWESEILA